MLNARRLGRLTGATWSALILLWLLNVNGSGLPLGLSRWVFAVALASTLASLVFLGRQFHLRERRLCALFLALLGLALVFGLAGLGHEVGQGYYTDEGHYLHHARQINDGKLFSRSFIYPHLTYYLGGFALWLADLFPSPVSFLARAIYGVTDPLAIPWLVLRLVTATLGALTVVPVFFLAQRLAGPWAAGLSSALMVFSVHYQEGFQVNISDVPSAFFATWCVFFAARLAREESRRDYLLAGLASGLAAAAKYPAGVVCVAIVAVWVVHRVADRQWNWGLVWAGAASLGVFLICTPSFFVHPEAALHGPRGIFFGVNQYGKGGWVGVRPESNTLYYAERLLENFRWPALLLAMVGAFALAAPARRQLARLTPFPVTYLVLICSMNMVVLRNLFPVIPILAVFLGVCLSGLVTRLANPPLTPWRRLTATALAALALVWPATATVRQTATLAAPSTRDLMAAWVRDHVPVGVGILKESYTPDFTPHAYRTIERRFAYRIHQQRFDDPDFDFVLLAGNAHGRWLRPENQDKPWGDWYRALFETHQLVHKEKPGPWRRGPELSLYRLRGRPEPAVRNFKPEDAFITHRSMARGESLRFTVHGRTAVFATFVEPGLYRVEVEGQLKGPGRLLLRHLDGEVLARASLDAGGGEVQVPRPGKVFLALDLPRGSTVEEFRLLPALISR